MRSMTDLQTVLLTYYIHYCNAQDAEAGIESNE